MEEEWKTIWNIYNVLHHKLACFKTAAPKLGVLGKVILRACHFSNLMSLAANPIVWPLDSEERSRVWEDVNAVDSLVKLMSPLLTSSLKPEPSMTTDHRSFMGLFGSIEWRVSSIIRTLSKVEGGNPRQQQQAIKQLSREPASSPENLSKRPYPSNVDDEMPSPDHNDWREQSKKIFNELEQRLRNMKFAAPKLKHKSFTLAEYILSACHFAENMRLVAYPNQQPLDDEERRQLWEAVDIVIFLESHLSSLLASFRKNVSKSELMKHRWLAKFFDHAESLSVEINIISRNLQRRCPPPQSYHSTSENKRKRPRQHQLPIDTGNNFKRLKTGQLATTIEGGIEMEEDYHNSPKALEVRVLVGKERRVRKFVVRPCIRHAPRNYELLKLCKGNLIFDPSDCVKAMLAEAVVKECGANFITISLSSKNNGSDRCS